MKLNYWCFELALAQRWAIAVNAASGGKTVSTNVFVQLESPDGFVGLGESAPPERYGETVDTVVGFLQRVDPARLSFQDLDASMRFLESVAPGNPSAKGALNVACSGARPIAIPNCLNLGSPEPPEGYWRLSETVAGLGAACAARRHQSPTELSSAQFCHPR